MQPFGDTDNLDMDWERKVSDPPFASEHGGGWISNTEGEIGTNIWNSKCSLWDYGTYYIEMLFRYVRGNYV